MQKRIIMTFGILIVISVFISLFQVKEQPRVDLPEEWKAISEDCTLPDTLTAYIRDGVVYFNFIPNN